VPLVATAAAQTVQAAPGGEKAVFIGGKARVTTLADLGGVGTASTIPVDLSPALQRR
jgi:hypothetical protein